MTFSDRGTVKRVYCCGHGGYCNGFRGDLDTYRCECKCHEQPSEQTGEQTGIGPGEVPAEQTICSWCNAVSVGTATHNDGLRWPSCGDHGIEFRPSRA